ncbi:SAM-dependent methyltransferase [Sphingomonas radiodurans]|uniref:SAM-dependent methyltransferase n=1 Tax=Sphingomonas radiodurans TaxID=2890321 RepID=UPI001E3EF255|nr:cyclopropane-fatty-acyl-phospholipid synthase family protein [Sphingomonas radiodurans]WBH16004.1 cyclopropane-fatty-acyl-phospholipid synthase [Sphingomonas radiodurans]
MVEHPAPGGRWARRVAPLYHRILDRIDAGLEEGAIEAAVPDGTRRLIGGRRDGPLAIVTIVRWRALRRLITGGSIGWYEAWAAGDWTSPDPVPIFDLFMRNRTMLGSIARAKSGARIAARVLHLLRRNDRSNARRNIAAHYDLGNDFFEAWLDPSMTYSSALFAGNESLERAQRRKIDAILDRVAVPPGGILLEIGCGWGSLAEAAARRGLKVRAITLATEQQRVVAERTRGLPVAVSLTDYRDVTGQYDAVASVEMVESVGEPFWRDYLAAVARALKPGGRAALQFIKIADDVWPAYSTNVDFIQAFVFPGGMLIHEPRFRALAAEAGLTWQDRHAFGQDYAQTLRLWREQFEAAAAAGRLPARFDRGFVELWRYYLMYCEGGFRGGGIDVVQITMKREGL